MTRLRLSLAVRAPESDPLLARVALLGPADRGPAPTAGSACPPVGPGFLAAPDYACGDDACSLLVGLQQSVPKFYEGTQVRHLSDRPPRAEAPEEQHFCSKYIADPGQVALVEQGLADRPGLALTAAWAGPGCELRRRPRACSRPPGGS